MKNSVSYFASAFLCAVLCSCSGNNSAVKNQPVPLPIEPSVSKITDAFTQTDYVHDQFEQDGSGGKVDLLFVIDNSVSMLEEQIAVFGAANSALQTLKVLLPKVSIHIGAITTNTVASANPAYFGTTDYNPNPQPAEAYRESWCSNPNNPSGYIPGTTVASYCQEDWKVNGTLGQLRRIASAAGANHLTGDESNAAAAMEELLKAGLAGSYIESSAMALGMFLNNTGKDLELKRPDALLAIVDVTDAEDGSASDCGTDDGALNDPQCALGLSTRPPLVAGSSDVANPGFYVDLNQQFRTLLESTKADKSLINFNFIGALPGISTCTATLESFDTRMHPLAALYNGLAEDICELENYDNILQQIAGNIVSQLNKQFSLTYHEALPIWAGSMKVKIAGVETSAYNYLQDAGLVLLDAAPSIGSNVQISYWAPQTSGFKLSHTPIPETIVVMQKQADGTQQVIDPTWWELQPDNSITFVGGATNAQGEPLFKGPQPGDFSVSYVDGDFGEK